MLLKSKPKAVVKPKGNYKEPLPQPILKKGLKGSAISEVPIHSAVMITPEGYYIKSEHYEHETEGEE